MKSSVIELLVFNIYGRDVLKVLNACIVIIVLSSLSLSLSGRATIVSGRSQNIMVATDPSDASVTVNNSTQKTPTTFNLSKNTSFYILKISKEGFKTEEVKIKRGLGGWFFGNIIFGGLIGIVVDLGTGSAYKFTPNNINVTLTPGNDPLTPVSNVVTPTIKTQAASKCEGVVGGPEWTACMGLK